MATRQQEMLDVLDETRQLEMLRVLDETRQPEMLDVLDEECRELHRCSERLELLYYTCGATEIAIEHLIRPDNPIGLDFKSVVAQLRNFKGILDEQMEEVRSLFINIQKCSERLQAPKDDDDPEKVNRLRASIVDSRAKLRSSIKQGALTCRGFQFACKIVLDHLVEMYCKAKN